MTRDDTHFELELFVVGHTPTSDAALENLRVFCARFLPGRHTIAVTDVLEDPVAAESANVVATPTLIRRSPPPPRRLIGDLATTLRVMEGLGIDPSHEHGVETPDEDEGETADG